MTFLEYALEDAKLRASIYLKMIGRSASVAAMSELLPMEAEPEMLAPLHEQFRAQLTEALLRGDLPRYPGLVRSFSQVGLIAFELALADYLWPDDWREVWEEMDEKGLTVENAARLTFFVRDPQLVYFREMQAAYGELSPLFHFAVTSATDPMRTILRMDQRLWGYFSGEDTLTAPFDQLGEIVPLDTFEGEMVIRGELLERLKADAQQDYSDLTDGAPPLYHMHGPAECGKYHLIRCYECEHHDQLIVLNYEPVAEMDAPSVRRILWYFYRECRLYEAPICIRKVPDQLLQKKKDLELFLDTVIRPYLGHPWRISLCTTDSASLVPLLRSAVRDYPIGEPDREERFLLWQAMLRGYGLETSLDLDAISSKYRLSPDQIRKAAMYLAMEQEEGRELTEQLLTEVCDRVIPPPEGGSIKRIRTTYTLDDLKLAESQKDILRHVVAQMTQRHKVFDTWGTKSRYAYGTGVSVLFSGPPGTGKTMASQVLSQMLGLPLYRIDLSQVTDKYIGESEKKLEEVFRVAEKGNMILFFDEADAVFGKRSEVTEAKDRYANTEVSYILQRIEEYDGVSILATNNKKNMDNAFMRRIRFVVDFTMPDARTRKELWMSCFAKDVPVKNIDFDHLAESYELSGSNIKNIALNAIFLAAEEGSPVTMNHIQQSLQLERTKVWIQG